jgi:hypothetical protein
LERRLAGVVRLELAPLERQSEAVSRAHVVPSLLHLARDLGAHGGR